AGLWYLLEWLDTARWRDALIFAVCAALLWRVQLIFWPFYLVFGICLVERLWTRQTTVTWARAGALTAGIGLTLASVIVRALALYRQAPAHVVIALPSSTDLANSFKFGLIATFGGTAWFLNHLFGWKRWSGATPRYIPILACWLCQPLGLFAF